MLQFKFDIDKAISAILYIAGQLDQADFHKVFKILYFADRNHLVKYGRPISGDHYYAMKNGPVPSKLYDVLKIVRGDSVTINEEFSRFFTVQNGFVIHPNMEPDMDEFSESDLECLNESITENKPLNFDKLTRKSHDKAWEKALKDDRIDETEIAKAGGATNEMIDYIKSVSENESFCIA